MELLAATLLGVVVAMLGFLAFYWTFARERREVSALVSGVRGEERLNTLEQGIQQSLREVRDSSDRAADIVRDIDRARGESIADLSAVVRESRGAIETLQASTSKLAETLSSSQARGLWGERMAEDVVRAAGFVENINYRRNKQIEGGRRPDFTFILPENRVLNMDVKFPIANYVRYVELEPGPQRDSAAQQFLADFRTMIRDVATRDYVDPASGTLDFMLVFIPNEQIYAFVHERDADLVDDALNRRVVLCSPLTLFAMLSVIRQASESFALAHATDEILRALGVFHREWSKYHEAVEVVGRRVQSLQRAYDDLSGPRTRVLERRLAEVDELRLEQRIELPAADDEEEQAEPLADWARGAPPLPIDGLEGSAYDVREVFAY